MFPDYSVLMTVLQLFSTSIVMKQFSVLLLCLFAAAAVHADLYRALEEDQDLQYWKHEGWVEKEKVGPQTVLELSFALKQKNVDQLEELLLEVSNPDSKLYGKYLSVDQITELISPTKQTIGVVKSWLANLGVTNCQLTLNKDFLLCTMPCQVAESVLLGSDFCYFHHNKLSKRVIRSTSRYFVPEDVAEHLDFVGGVHRFPAVNYITTKTERLPVLDKTQVGGIHIGITPKVLRQKYNLRNTDVGSHPDNSQVVAQFLEQYFSNGDLSEFMTMFVGSEFPHRNTIDKIIGPNGSPSGVEASLDTQYIMGLGANISTWFWSTGGTHENQEPFLRWLLEVSNTTKVPWVHSVSYGDDEGSLSTVYMKRINEEFMKLGLRGSSILFASGDSGAGCKGKVFSPSFPVSSPYVTGVGGTAFKNPFTVSPEYAYEISGGGFSNVFKRPRYQTERVEEYLESGKAPPAKYFNKTGRAYPDIAAICRHYWIVNNRIPIPGVMGTSASTPTVAGIISMLNEVRLRAGKPTMGFLNPFLYKNSKSLNDITGGYNEGCQQGDIGFYATKGFDPVTGNGTPNYPELVKAAMKMFA